MATFLLELLVAAALAVLIRFGAAYAGHWVAWQLAAVIALVVVVGGLMLVDAPNMRQWWR